MHSPPPPFQGCRALLAEDDEDVRIITSSYLEILGFEVDAVADGTTFLEAADHGRAGHDLLVVDIDLPGVSGCTAVEGLRAEGVDLPVLLVTGGSGPDATPPGPTEVLYKPYGLDDLSATLTAMIDQSLGLRNR